MYNDTMSAAMKFGPQQLGTFEMEISSLKLLTYVYLCLFWGMVCRSL